MISASRLFFFEVPFDATMIPQWFFSCYFIVSHPAFFLEAPCVQQISLLGSSSQGGWLLRGGSKVALGNCCQPVAENVDRRRGAENVDRLRDFGFSGIEIEDSRSRLASLGVLG